MVEVFHDGGQNGHNVMFAGTGLNDGKGPPPFCCMSNKMIDVRPYIG